MRVARGWAGLQLQQWQERIGGSGTESCSAHSISSCGSSTTNSGV
jgi:hypothetical protein